MLIAVSSFGESLRRVLLTTPAEAVFINEEPALLKPESRVYAEEKLDPA